jgi:DNA-binding transcriptional LysR family regulator
VRFEQIVGERLALLNARFAMRRILERIFAQRNLQLSPAIEIDNVATLKLIVQRGGVSTVLPQSLLAPGDRQAGVVALPIRDVTEVFTFALVYRLIGTLSPPAQAFVRAVSVSVAERRASGAEL